MFRAINNYLKDRILGELVHSYDEFKLTHGPARCRNRFEIRRKNGIATLYHHRVWQDKHDVDKIYEEYSLEDVEALIEVYTGALDCIAESRFHDFGLILELRKGRAQSRKFFYVEPSSGDYYLFRRREYTSPSSSSTAVTYFPLDEIASIAETLIDARGRMGE